MLASLSEVEQREGEERRATQTEKRREEKRNQKQKIIISTSTRISRGALQSIDYSTRVAYDTSFPILTSLPTLY